VGEEERKIKEYLKVVLCRCRTVEQSVFALLVQSTFALNCLVLLEE